MKMQIVQNWVNAKNTLVSTKLYLLFAVLLVSFKTQLPSLKMQKMHSQYDDMKKTTRKGLEKNVLMGHSHKFLK